MQTNENAKNTLQLLKYYQYLLSSFGDTLPFSAFPVPIKIDIPTKKLQNISPVATTVSDQPVYTKKDTKKEEVPKKVPNITNTSLENVHTIEDLQNELLKQDVCEIQKFANKTVFIDGNYNAKILIIGEAPGQEEDEKGIPFCGRSGELLMNAFSSIGLKREKNFCITNTVFWRPPGNRNPYDYELNACKPFLQKLIEIVAPEVIICVGAVASQNILVTEKTISSMRGVQFSSDIAKNAKIFCIYHPSYLLRNPSKKYEMYRDLLTILPNISHLL